MANAHALFKSEKGKIDFEDFPSELILLIASFLRKEEDFIALGRVCSRFKKIIFTSPRFSKEAKNIKLKYAEVLYRLNGIDTNNTIAELLGSRHNNPGRGAYTILFKESLEKAPRYYLDSIIQKSLTAFFLSCSDINPENPTTLKLDFYKLAKELVDLVQIDKEKNRPVFVAIPNLITHPYFFKIMFANIKYKIKQNSELSFFYFLKELSDLFPENSIEKKSLQERLSALLAQEKENILKTIPNLSEEDKNILDELTVSEMPKLTLK